MHTSSVLTETGPLGVMNLAEAWKAAGVPADLPALREAYAREQAAKKQRV